MCGLIGGVGRIPSPGRIEAAMRRLQIRGPDAQAMELHHDYWMGHTLLAIRQPPQEQPIHARDARITLVYNGELYDTAGSGAHDTAALPARIVPVLRAADPLAERPGLNGDAPVFFSGGVDSALLARLLDRAGAQVTLRTLSITDSVLDQGTQAGKAARCLGLPLETVELDPAGVAGGHRSMPGHHGPAYGGCNQCGACVRARFAA